MTAGHVNVNKAKSRAKSEWIRMSRAVKGSRVFCAALVPCDGGLGGLALDPGTYPGDGGYNIIEPRDNQTLKEEIETMSRSGI
jgi:hypothetical protein